jgi:hypothetical protein
MDPFMLQLCAALILGAIILVMAKVAKDRVPAIVRKPGARRQRDRRPIRRGDFR